MTIMNLLKTTRTNQQQGCPQCAPPPSSPPNPPGQYLRENGVIFLTDEFNQEKIMPIVAQITEYNLMPEEIQPEYISLVINSPGGVMASMFHLVDAMNLSDIPIRTLGFGTVASCGVFTLMAGAKGGRYMTSNTSVMSHQYSGGAGGKEHEIYSRYKEMELTSDRTVDHYRRYTGKSESYIRKNLLHQSDEWLTPEECLKHGIVDFVVDPYDDTVVDLKSLRDIEKARKAAGSK